MGTRHYERYDMNHPTLLDFQAYLTGVDGGARGEKTAAEMAVDVSKFLYYASGSSSPSPSWQRLTNRYPLLGYLEKLKCSSVGPEGRLGKLDARCCIERFLKVEVLREMMRRVMFPKHAGSYKRLESDPPKNLCKRRLQELSCQDLSLDALRGLVP